MTTRRRYDPTASSTSQTPEERPTLAVVGASSHHPHIRDGFSPLEALALAALRRRGDSAPDLADAGLALMMLELANDVVEEVRAHPYWPKDQTLDYYTSLADARPIPDPIMSAGLVAMHALQQGSQAAGVLVGRYRSVLNQVLWNRLSGSTRPRMRVTDNGTNPRAAPQRIDPITGQVVAELGPPDRSRPGERG